MPNTVDRQAPAVHVVVTCANRKKQPVPARLRLQNLTGGGTDERCAAWIRRLSAGTPTIAAKELYAGEHWKVARDLGKAVGPCTNLWVSSAGYGLISANASIHAYAATFASGQLDSVATTADGARRWWSGLSKWEGPQAGEPRTFAALAEREPDSVIIAVLSDAYLRACSEDLKDAAARLADIENFSIFGPPGRYPEIDDLVVPVTAALRPVVGGSLQALNVRAAEHVLLTAREHGIPLQKSSLAKLIADATAAAPEDTGRRAAGKRLSDDAVRTFICANLSKSSSATKLLRLLRNSGQSCEQARFKALFAQVAETTDLGGLF